MARHVSDLNGPSSVAFYKLYVANLVFCLLLDTSRCYAVAGRSSCCNIYNVRVSCRFVWAFAKFRKGAISFVLSVCRSVWNNSAPAERIFMKFCLNIFRKCEEKIQESLKSEKNSRYFTRRQIFMFDGISLSSS